MKLRTTFILSAALLCGGVMSAMPSALSAAVEQHEVQTEKELRGADGDVRYSVTRLNDGQFVINLSVVADDKDTELMRILNSGSPINLSASAGKLFSTHIVDKQKLRGTVVAKLQSDPLDYNHVIQIAETRGETLRLGAEGFALVLFPTGSDVAMPGMNEMLAQHGIEAVLPATSANDVVNTPAPQPEVKVAEKKPEAPKPVLQGTPFKIKNENGLFKIEGTNVETQGLTNGNMLRVQESIMRTKQCKTAAMNMSTGGLYIYSSNGYATTTGLPKMLKDVLKVLNVPHTNINEVALTESNKWVIVYEKSGFKTSEGLQRSMLDKMGECNAAKQNFKSICMADDGTWAIVTNKGYWCEGDELKAFLAEAVKKFGSLQAVHYTPEGAKIAVCKNGIMCENVPKTVVATLKTLEFVPKVIKFTQDGRYIITDGKERVEYYL